MYRLARSDTEALYRKRYLTFAASGNESTCDLDRRLRLLQAPQQVQIRIPIRRQSDAALVAPNAIARGRDGHASFRLHLDGFAHTEDRRTIHINVVEQASVSPLRQRIADHVRADRRIKKLGVQVPERTLLPIATGLKAAQFEAAWNLLSPHPFTGEVRVNDVVLLKRELADTSLDEHVRTFPFDGTDRT